MKYFTLGFLFGDNREEVVLIEKDRPAWQAGMVNGTGGKFEECVDNSLEDCMYREFKEETGLNIYPQEWRRFCVMKSIRNDYEVHCFSAFVDCETLNQIQQMESEVPFIAEVNKLPANCVVNLYYLIPMALNMDKANCRYYVITEEH